MRFPLIMGFLSSGIMLGSGRSLVVSRFGVVDWELPVSGPWRSSVHFSAKFSPSKCEEVEDGLAYSRIMSE